MEKGCAILATDKATRYYFSQVELDEGLMLIGEKKVYFTDARYFHMVKDKLVKNGITPVLFTDISCVEKEINRLSISMLGLDYSKVTLREYEKFRLLSARLFDASSAISGVRQVKTEREIELISRACKITEKAYKKAVKSLKEGVSELEIKSVIVEEYKRLGSDGESFDTIVAFGKNSAIPHHKTGKTKLKKNQPVLIDMGCVYKGYCSDLTRTLFFGTPSEKFKNAYNAVLLAHEKAVKNIKSGFSLKEADEIARLELKKYSLDKNFTHSLGHGVGVEIHEAPTLSPKSTGVLREGMVFTIEPGVYFNNKFGIRIEDKREYPSFSISLHGMS